MKIKGWIVLNKERIGDIFDKGYIFDIAETREKARFSVKNYQSGQYKFEIKPCTIIIED